jgi:hypothetical protein
MSGTTGQERSHTVSYLGYIDGWAFMGDHMPFGYGPVGAGQVEDVESEDRKERGGRPCARHCILTS